MTDGYESVGEIGRAFDAFKADIHEEFKDIGEELKWQRRWLIAFLTTVVLASFGSSAWVVLAR
jgi:hypothetical protein